MSTDYLATQQPSDPGLVLPWVHPASWQGAGQHNAWMLTLSLSENVELLNRINGFLSWNFCFLFGLFWQKSGSPFCIIFFFSGREGLLRNESCIHAYKYSLQSVAASLTQCLEKLILERVNILVLGILSWVPSKWHCQTAQLALRWVLLFG